MTLIEKNSIRCPICNAPILVAWNDKLKPEKEIDEYIRKHATQHTLGDVLDFIELSLARQVNEIEKRLKTK